MRDRINQITERGRSRGLAGGGSLRARWGGMVDCGVAHEWFDERVSARASAWSPPLCLLADLAALAFDQRAGEGLALWIGRRCWPYAALLARWPDLLRASVLVDTPSDAERLWAIDTAARSPACTALIADGQGLNLAATRRVQLAAGVGGGVCLLARPARDAAELSAASARWRVTPERSDCERPRWTVTLLRDKARPAVMDHPPAYSVEWDDETGAVGLPARLVGAARESAAAGLGRATA